MAISTITHKNALSPLIMLLVPILGLLLYFGTLDDEIINEGTQVTTANAQVNATDNWTTVWTAATPSHQVSRCAYRPVLVQLLRWEYKLWESSPSSYHSLNLILFLGVLLLFLRLSGSLTDRPSARLVAVITLALHPMFSQAVENIAAQGVLLSLLACLGAACLMQLYRQQKLGLGWSIALITFLGVIAVGSYEMGLLLPIWLAAIAALTHVEPPARPPRKSARRAPAEDEDDEDLGPLSPAAKVLAFGFPLLGVIGLYLYLRNQALGGLAPQPLAGVGSALAIGPSIVVAYLCRLFWPAHPTYFYLFPESGGYLLLPALGWFVFALLLALTLWACLRRRTLGLALLLLLTPLIALAHWVPLTFFMSEQPLAFALPGLCLLLGAVVGQVTASAWNFPPAGLRDKLVVGLLVLAWVAMGWQVIERGKEWNKAETLWDAEVARHPGRATPLVEKLGNYARQTGLQGATERARSTARAARPVATPEELERIIEWEAVVAANLKDDDRLKELIDETLGSRRPGSLEYLSRMANLARTRDFVSESFDLWRRELKYYPKSFEAITTLAVLEEKNKNFQESLRLSFSAVLNANNKLRRAQALELYGIALANTGQYPAALFNLNQALTLDRTLYRAYIYMARIHWGMKNYTQAETAIRACYANVGPRLISYRDLAELETGVLESQNKPQEAVDFMIQQMNQFPSDIPLQIYGARYLIAMAVYDKGLYDRAIQAYSAVMRVQGAPKADIGVGMGLIALYGQNDPATARRWWEQVIQKLDPLNAEAKHFLAELDAAESSKSKPTPRPEGSAPLAVAPTPAPRPVPPSSTPAAPSSATPKAVPPATPALESPTPAIPSGGGMSLGNPFTSPSAPPPAPAIKPLGSPIPATPAAAPAVATPASAPVATPVSTPVATPASTPVATPAATPVAPPAAAPATPVAPRAATPASAPVATPAATPVAKPAAPPASAPVAATPAPK